MSSEYHQAPDQVEESELMEGPVKVDQRALVRKVLARYPGEFTLFRELLQNSDDARSETVKIHFDVDEKSSNVVKWTFENTGKPFALKDWTRLTRIADGNPDAKKVGAFGVGFYSVFSVTDCPVVSSGGRRVEFYWQDDTGQLYFRPTRHPTDETGAIIEIPLREPAPIPDKNDLMRFLATSITFMAHIKVVQVFADEDCMGCISKSDAIVESINLPIAPPVERDSPVKIMTVNPFQRHRLAIEFSPDLLPENRNAVRVDLAIFTVEVGIKVDHKLSKELSRCMFKEPDSLIKYSLIYTGRDDYDQGSKDQRHSVFQGLRADLDEALHSRIFIGHSTSQTTGIGGHMASQFIPTVERESIDLVDKNVAIWNSELLYLGGFLSRSVYELELNEIEAAWTNCNQASDFKRLHERFIHILKFFTFRPSTPSPKVAEKLCNSFFTCSRSPLRLLSSKGVRNASDIRLFDSLCDKFLAQVPMLPSDVTVLAERFVQAYPGNQEIQPVDLLDVENDLREHTLDGPNEQLVACLRWIIREWTTGADRLLQVASFRGANGMKVGLSSIQHFVHPNNHGIYIPPDAPLPSSVIPRHISNDIAPANLQKFHWKEFTVFDWLGYITLPAIRTANARYDFTRSPDWADCVLVYVSFAWPFWKDTLKSATSAFANETCIPTTCGLRIPAESYLPGSYLCVSDNPHLPIVQLPSRREISGEMEQLLVTLGVRKHLPPQHLSSWKTVDLINYLVEVADSLTDAETKELKSSPIFAKEGSSHPRFRLNELYPPVDHFRQLGLPLIDWGRKRKWKDESDKVKQILHRFGLCRSPPLREIMRLCSQNTEVAEYSFEYLCANLHAKYPDYNLEDYQDTAFIPAENIDAPNSLEKPGGVFLDKHWKTFGFPVVRSGYHESALETLGIQRHPSSSSILQRLKDNPPSSEEIARQWFEILSGHIARFRKEELDSLSRHPLVPETTTGPPRMLAPVECYLVKSSTKHDLYSKLFPFVDFASGEPFLRACGAKNEPTEEDVARRLIHNPQEFYDHAGYKRFLQELHDLASRLTRISNETIGEMKLRPILLGAQPCEKVLNPDGWKDTYALWEPREILIVDDIQTFQLFADSIVVAPRDMPRELEDFYVLLGCRTLTTAVRDQPSASGEKEDPEMGSKYQTLILDRLPLFLHNYPHLKPGSAASRFNGVHDIIVTIWKELFVSKTLISGKTTTRKRPVSATAMYDPQQKTVQLWFTDGVERDKHDLALSLCRVLLGTENRPDVEFLTACLSEDLDVLKRRGYEIDQVALTRCLNDWKLSTGKVNSCTTVFPSSPMIEPPETLSATDFGHLPAECEGAVGSSMLSSAASPASTWVDKSKEDMLRGSRLSSIMSRAKFAGTTFAKYTQSPSQVMDQTHIETTVEAAVKACKSSQQEPPLRHSDPVVTEFVRNGYCDISAPVDDLRPFRQVQNVIVYAIQGISDVDTFIACKQEPLIRFLQVVKFMTEVYDLPTKSFRIFYETSAGRIACNYKGTLYLNLQYFEKWHYEDVKKGNKGQVLSFWFLTLAHEIAHNLIPSHDSEHEFWFLEICNKHMDKFVQLLGTASV